jgi:hypothetical protein
MTEPRNEASSVTVSELPSPQARRDWTTILGRRRLTQFERALMDPDLVSLRQELVKLDLRIAEIEERGRRGESDKAWNLVNKLANRINDTLAGETLGEKQIERLRDYAQQLSTVAQEGVGDYAMWKEITDLMELRRKTADTERKYEELHKVLIPATQLTVLFDELYGAIEEVVPDRGMQLKLLMEVRGRLNGEVRARRAAIPIVLPEAYLATGTPDEVTGVAAVAEEPEHESLP